MRILNSFIDAYTNIWYGIIVAVIVVAALFFIIAAMQGSNKRFSPLTYVKVDLKPSIGSMIVKIEFGNR